MTQQIDFDNLYRVAFTDPAGAKRSQSELRAAQARQAAVVVGQDDLMRVFVLHAWAGRLTTPEYLDKLIQVCEDFKPRIFGIESNAMQSLFADCVHFEAGKRLRKWRNVFSDVSQSTRVDKIFRIRTALQPVIGNGRLFLLSSQTEAYNEITGFPTAKFKDIVDCLASAVSLLPKRARVAKQSDEARQLAAYLRSTGAPSSYIERRMREIEQEGS